MEQKKKPNKVVFALVGVLFLLGIAGGAIWYTQFGGDKAVKNITGQSNSSSDNDSNVSQNSNDSSDEGESREVAEGMVIYSAPKSDLKEGTDGGFPYLSNVLKCSVEKGISKEQVEEKFKPYGGKIVGWISQANNYTIKLDKSYSEEDLEAMASELSKDKDFRYVNVYYDIPAHTNTSSLTPNDSAWVNQWDDNPKTGNNWNMKAIKAPDMWSYIAQIEYTNVGVFDSGLFENHPDMHFKETFKNDNMQFLLKNPNSKDPRHGTHVAGIISAMFNNNEYVAGVAPKTNLYGTSYAGINTDDRITVDSYEAGLTWLISAKECKVVNLSMGSLFGGDNQNTISKIKNRSDEIADALQQYLDEGKDFVIVKSAGNENNKADGGMLASNDVLSDLDSKYQDVTDRIIVVGSMKYGEHNTFASEFSNYGERVDVMAPGEKIQSLGYKLNLKPFGNKDDINAYNLKPILMEMSGTSMAAPHVAGVAASLYGLDSSLTGADVKRIICDTATISCKYEDSKYNVKDYKLLDAGAAATEAMVLEAPNTGVGSENSEFFASLPEKFTFTSGAGGWQTVLTMDGKGGFTGIYADYDNDQVTRCDFKGSFKDVQKISDLEYSMKIANLKITGPEAGMEGNYKIKPVNEVYGIVEGDEVKVYLPGRQTSDLPERFLGWMYGPLKLTYENPETNLPFFALFTMTQEAGFSSDEIEGLREKYKPQPKSTPVSMEGKWAFKNPQGEIKNYLTVGTNKEDGSKYNVYSPAEGPGASPVETITFTPDNEASWEKGYWLTLSSAQSNTPLVKLRIAIINDNKMNIISNTSSGVLQGTIDRIE